LCPESVGVNAALIEWLSQPIATRPSRELTLFFESQQAAVIARYADRVISESRASSSS
jgi:hypothetical protein